MSDDYKKWEWTNLKEYACMEKGYASSKEAIKENNNEIIDSWIKECALRNYDKVFRTAAIGGGAKIKRQKTIDYSSKHRDEIFVHENEDVAEFYILNGEQILFYKNRFKEIDGVLQPSQTITDVWTDISWTGIASEGNVIFKNSKKPELLLKRVLDIFTNEGDWVLDSFLGSGTTCAVAHKMNRKWIGIEMAEHCYTHCKKRLDYVIEGDTTGISKAVNWKGGGGYKFYELAPSLLVKDKFDNWIISENYNGELLTRAICKQEKFDYIEKSETYWKQGKSSENDFIYVTTNYISLEYLDAIHEEMQENESLLICCKTYQEECEDRYENITIKKIPQTLLNNCEYGKDDYSLNVKEVLEIDEDYE